MFSFPCIALPSELGQRTVPGLVAHGFGVRSTAEQPGPGTELGERLSLLFAGQGFCLCSVLW